MTETRFNFDDTHLTLVRVFHYNTIQCGYLVPPIHETGPGGITMVIKCV